MAVGHAQLFRSVVDSPLGPLTLLVSERGVRAIHFGNVPGPADTLDSDPPAQPLARQLRDYFNRRRRDFDLPLDLEGTAFQQKVWRALLAIPYGKTASYADVARAIRRPRAFRAVGGANRRNPLPIVVPCHRVIGSDGALVGYGGRSGLGIKAQLLALERGAN
ncbi:MAG: methylated-DNA--[protein]-cysteine S-methyltransferase [Terriglobales bacterium]